MKAILITIGQLNIGGAERRLLQLVRSLRGMALPLRITMFVVSGKPGTFDDQFRAAGVDLVFGHPGVRGLIDLWVVCRRLRPQVLHINAETAAGFYALAGFLAGVPTRLAHYRSMRAPRRPLPAVKSWVYQVLTNIFCQRIIGVSDGSRQGRLILRPWQTVYNGITPPTPQEVLAMAVPAHYHLDRVRVVVLGRITTTKNVDRAIRLFAAFRRRRPDAELHIVGPFATVSPGELHDVIRSAGVSDAVVIHGAVSEPFQYLGHSSLLLLTSTVEGLPGAVLEALACGVPVVSTNLPGAQEIAARTPGVRCVPLSADDDTWAATMVEALGDSPADLSRSFRASPFSADRHVHDILAIWNGAF